MSVTNIQFKDAVYDHRRIYSQLQLHIDMAWVKHDRRECTECAYSEQHDNLPSAINMLTARYHSEV